MAEQQRDLAWSLAVVSLSLTCVPSFFTVGPTNRRNQELADRCDRDERGELEGEEMSARWVGGPPAGWCPPGAVLPPAQSLSLLLLPPLHSRPPVCQGALGARGGPCLSPGEGSLGFGALMPCLTPDQIKVEFSMKFTSRDMSLKRTPSKKQTGVFGVKISVVTK